MSAPRRTADIAQPPADPSPPGPTLNDHLRDLLVVCLVGGGVAAFFLGLYAVKHYQMPIGYDTPRYLFQTTLAGRFGLAHVPAALPPPSRSLASRTGFPVVVLTLSSLFGSSTFKVAAIVPAVGAAAVALASGALVSWSLERRAWELGLVAVVVGTSAMLVRLMAPETYTDNLFAAGLFVAGMIPLASVLRGQGGFAVAIALLGVGALVHPPLFVLVAGVLVVMAILFAPSSWRAWRAGERPLLGTSTGRIGMVLGGAAAVAGVGFYGVLRTGPVAPVQTRFELTKKLSQDVPLYRFQLTAPIAAVGAAALAACGLGSRGRHPRPDLDDPASARRRFTARVVLALFLAWIAAALAGVVMFEVGRRVPAHRFLPFLIPRNSPAHRFLAFLIPLPILAAIGILAIGHALARKGGRARVPVAVTVVGVMVVSLAMLGARDFYLHLPNTRQVKVLDVRKVGAAATAGRYLDLTKVPSTAPVVYVIDDSGPNPISFIPEMTYMIRSVLSAERIEHAYFYAGSPANYLAGRPTYRPLPGSYNHTEQIFWPAIRSLLPCHPVSLLLEGFNPAFPAFLASHPSWVAGQGLIVLRGVRLARPIGPVPYPSGPIGADQGVLLAVGTLAVVTIIGIGWAIALLPSGLRPFELLALAPAMGLGALIVAGIAVDAAGVRLRGVGGGLTPVLGAMAGLLAAAIRWKRSRPGRRPFPG